VAVSEEAIRVRAYFLSLERQQDGSDPVQNWLDAERTMTEEANSGIRARRKPSRRFRVV
jgi:hypothetical protein